MHTKLLHGAAHALAVDASSYPSVQGIQQLDSMLSQSFPQKSVGGKLHSHSKLSSNGPSPDNFQSIGAWLLQMQHCMYCVTVLGWLKKEEDEEEEEVTTKQEKRRPGNVLFEEF